MVAEYNHMLRIPSVIFIPSYFIVHPLPKESRKLCSMIYLQQMLKWQQFDLNSKLIEEKAPAFLKYGTFLFPGRLVLEVFAQRLNWEQFLMLLGIYWMADQQNEHMFSIDYPIIISLMEKELGPCKKLIKELNHLGYFQLECKQKEHLIRLPHLVEEFLDYEPTI